MGLQSGYFLIEDRNLSYLWVTFLLLCSYLSIWISYSCLSMMSWLFFLLRSSIICSNRLNYAFRIGILITTVCTFRCIRRWNVYFFLFTIDKPCFLIWWFQFLLWDIFSHFPVQLLRATVVGIDYRIYFGSRQFICILITQFRGSYFIALALCSIILVSLY